MSSNLPWLSRRALLSRALPAFGLARAVFAAPSQIRVKNDPLLLTFLADSSGIALSQIENTANGLKHLSGPSPLFKLAVEPALEGCSSNQNVLIEHIESSPNGASLSISGKTTNMPLQFSMHIESAPDAGVALVRLRVKNTGNAVLTIRVTAPSIQHLVTQGPEGSFMGVVPQEACGVASYSLGSPDLGMQPNPKIGLPTAMNFMELASLHDPQTGAVLFFADTEGRAETDLPPLQFHLQSDTVSGHWRTTLDPQQETSLPTFAIGVHADGGWRHAVDYYVEQHRPHWRFPGIPAWFRDQGAIYSFSGAGAGSIYMEYPQQDLKTRIASFREIPKLLQEAQSLGTNIVYLWDYWQGTPEGGRPQYWNKGDYIPRVDLGGAEALKDGIRALHERGGRIIVYVESFILFAYSHIGVEKGEEWAARRPDNSLYDQYPQNYSLPQWLPAWQDYLASVTERLVREFDVDGIFLDSLGWQMNWPAKTKQSVLHSSADYSRGVLTIADRVREAIQRVKPDAVVIGENTSGALPRHSHGGLAADFAWLAGQNQHRVTASPVRYAIPEANIYSNGKDRNQMNQIFAAGYSLALANLHLPEADYIRSLVQIRQQYKDALIYGKQEFQPRTGNADVAAYFFRGAVNHIVTVVNTSVTDYSGNLQLHQEHGSSWKDLLSNETLTASGDNLPIHVPAHGLRVLIRLSRNGEVVLN